MVYQKYLQGRPTCDVSPLPRYKVLVFLEKEFGDLMSSVSPRNRVGRLLFRTKCDPFVMLSHALGTAKKECKEEESSVVPQVKQVADYLNEKIHELSKQLIAEQEQAPVAANMFDLEAFTCRVDPHLWEAVSRLAYSTNDRHGRKQSDSHAHERKVRIAYVVCVLMFCATGGRCSVPLHTLLTDYIEASGGSSELISVLNRLGAIASSDTLDRHIMQVSVHRIKWMAC